MADSPNERRTPPRRKSPARPSRREGGREASRGKRRVSREEAAMRRAAQNTVAVPPPLVDVEEEAEKSIQEVLREEAKTGVPSLAVSFALHATILFVLTLFAITVDFDSESPLIGDWLVETKSDNPEPPKDVRKPVQVMSTQNIKKKEKKKTPKNTEGEKVVRPIQPVPIDKALAGRTERAKAGSLDKVGSKDDIKRAVSSGLAWVVRQQRERGNWELHSENQYPDPGSRTFRTDTGATALALLALLGDGHTHRDGDYQEEVAKGLRWLRGAQKVDGDFHDHVEMGRQSSFYAHAMAVIAMCEAITLSRDFTFHESAEAGVQFLLDSQHPTQGGWKYMPQDEDSSGDLSVTGWCLMALHTARMAEIDVPDEAFSRASHFMDLVADGSGAHYRYQPSRPRVAFHSRADVRRPAGPAVARLEERRHRHAAGCAVPAGRKVQARVGSRQAERLRVVLHRPGPAQHRWRGLEDLVQRPADTDRGCPETARQPEGSQRYPGQLGPGVSLRSSVGILARGRPPLPDDAVPADPRGRLTGTTRFTIRSRSLEGSLFNLAPQKG